MIRNKAVHSRAGLLPVIAALCVGGSIAAFAEDKAKTTESAAPEQAAAKVEEPAVKTARAASEADASPTAAPAAATAAPAAATATPAAATAAPAAATATPAAATAKAEPATVPEPTASPDAAAAKPASDNSIPAADTAKAAPATVPEPPAATSTEAAAPADQPAAEPAAPAADTAKAAPAAPASDTAATQPSAGVTPPTDTAALPDSASDAPVNSQVLPPADPVIGLVRERIPQLGQRASADVTEALTAYYGEHNGPAMWASTSGLTDKGKAAVAEIRKADDWGLPASDFSLPSTNTSSLTPEAAADTELQVALAVLQYARYARGGRINPRSISQLMDQEPTLVPPKTVLMQAAAADRIDEYLTSLHPQHPQFEALRQALLKLRGNDQKEDEPQEDPALSVKLPPGRLIRPGTSDPQVVLLRQRLKVPAADAATEEVYDDQLVEAVREFQRSKSLLVDGLIGNGTRNALNGVARPAPVSAESKIQRVLINMERWRWVAPDKGDFHVWDNVPEFLTRIVKDGRVIHSDKIIVGQPSWPTPVFSADMKTIVFRPSWGVPNGIKTKELAPLLRKSSGAGFFGIFGGGYSAQAVLDAYDLQAYQGGRKINPNSVNWASVDIRNYHFTQPPGPKNVLGEVKFMFPNSHDVYMHDTPERHLFAKSFRALSHGCMRVGQPRRLAEVLLAEDKGWSADRVDGMFRSGGEVALSKHIPVHVTYMTARVDDDGKLQTYGDIYGLDSRTSAALTGRSMQFEQPSYEEDDTPVAANQGYGQQQQAKRRKKQQQGPPTLADAISGLFSP